MLCFLYHSAPRDPNECGRARSFLVITHATPRDLWRNSYKGDMVEILANLHLRRKLSVTVEEVTITLKVNVETKRIQIHRPQQHTIRAIPSQGMKTYTWELLRRTGALSVGSCSHCTSQNFFRSHGEVIHLFVGRQPRTDNGLQTHT